MFLGEMVRQYVPTCDALTESKSTNRSRLLGAWMQRDTTVWEMLGGVCEYRMYTGEAVNVNGL